jgi:hypothetical protein
MDALHSSFVSMLIGRKITSVRELTPDEMELLIRSYRRSAITLQSAKLKIQAAVDALEDVDI